MTAHHSSKRHLPDDLWTGHFKAEWKITPRWLGFEDVAAWLLQRRYLPGTAPWKSSGKGCVSTVMKGQWPHSERTGSSPQTLGSERFPFLRLTAGGLSSFHAITPSLLQEKEELLRELEHKNTGSPKLECSLAFKWYSSAKHTLTLEGFLSRKFLSPPG